MFQDHKGTNLKWGYCHQTYVPTVAPKTTRNFHTHIGVNTAQYDHDMASSNFKANNAVKTSKQLCTTNLLQKQKILKICNRNINL